MSHLIQQVLEQFTTRLIAAGTYAGSNVQRDRDWPLAPAEGQAFDWLLVNEGADRVVESTPMRPRRLTEEIEIRVRAITRVASAQGPSRERCRELMKQVQLAMLGASADIKLGGIAKFMRYAGSEPIEDEMGLDAAARELSFIVTIQTSEASFQVST